MLKEITLGENQEWIHRLSLCSESPYSFILKSMFACPNHYFAPGLPGGSYSSGKKKKSQSRSWKSSMDSNPGIQDMNSYYFNVITGDHPRFVMLISTCNGRNKSTHLTWDLSKQLHVYWEILVQQFPAGDKDKGSRGRPKTYWCIAPNSTHGP